MKNIRLLLAVFSFVFVFAFSATAQDITFTSLGGEKINLASQKGKVVVLAIGASWLPLSKDQATAINKLAKKYAGRDIVFYFIATDSAAAKNKNYASDEQLRTFAASNKLGVTVLRDDEGEISRRSFSVDQLPVFIVLDKEGKLATKPFTGIDPKDDISVPISQTIDRILQ